MSSSLASSSAAVTAPPEISLQRPLWRSPFFWLHLGLLAGLVCGWVVSMGRNWELYSGSPSAAGRWTLSLGNAMVHLTAPLEIDRPIRFQLGRSYYDGDWKSEWFPPLAVMNTVWYLFPSGPPLRSFMIRVPFWQLCLLPLAAVGVQAVRHRRAGSRSR